MILSLFKKDPSKDAAESLYEAAVAGARTPALYGDLGVCDTVEGRFELVCLHVWLVLHRLNAVKSKASAKIGRRVMEAFVANLDDSLREMGVGDLSVGKKMRALAENFYGRIAAYEAALDAPDSNAALSEALARNVYDSADSATAEPLARYVRRCIAQVSEQPDGRITCGIIVFPQPERVSA